MDKIIGMGNALVDVLVTLQDDSLLDEMSLPKGSMQLINEDKFLKISGKFSGMKTHKATGGSAGNTVLALANLGAHPGFIGKIGNDDFGQYFKKNGLKQGIDMKLLAGDLPTGVASTFISPDGERTFGTYLGAAATMKAENLTLDMFKGYAYLYIEGYLVQDHELILRAMQLGKEAGLQICLDMASYNIVEGDLEFFDILITKYVDIVFANEEEAKAYTGKDAWGAINEIASKCSVVIVKLGAQGSCIKKGTECIKLEVVSFLTIGIGSYCHVRGKKHVVGSISIQFIQFGRLIDFKYHAVISPTGQVLYGCRPHHLVTSGIHPLEIIVRTINIKTVLAGTVRILKHIGLTIRNKFPKRQIRILCR